MLSMEQFIALCLGGWHCLVISMRNEQSATTQAKSLAG